MTQKQVRSFRRWLQRSWSVLVSSILFFTNLRTRYEILSDADARAAYDVHGMDGLTGGGSGPGMDAADLFAQFFSGGQPTFGFDFGPGRRADKGEDSVIPYDVTLEDLYNGKSVKINMEKDVVCSQCKGHVFINYFLNSIHLTPTWSTGAKGNAKPKPCSNCKGRGWTPTKARVCHHTLFLPFDSHTPQLPSGVYAASKAQCSDCKGTGEKLKEKERFVFRFFNAIYYAFLILGWN